MSKDNITKLKIKKQYRQETEIFHEIVNVFNDHSEEISLVAAIGILDLVSDHLKNAAKQSVEEHD